MLPGKDKMAIKLDKILTMSAKDYCEMQRKRLSDYKARGVHCYGGINSFKNSVPNETEVIVDYKFSITSAVEKGRSIENFEYASGTALIPKNIQKDKSKGK
jgi:hypothetical protein